jgi:Na+-transporting NADH:ubiquinone oxidoreductase subunit NqrC
MIKNLQKKLNYIQNNPVKKEFVYLPIKVKNYLFSLVYKYLSLQREEITHEGNKYYSAINYAKRQEY